MSSITNGQR